MPTPFTRTAIVTAWLAVVLGTFAITSTPLTLATSWALLFASCAPPAVFLVLARTPRVTLSEVIAEERRLMDRPNRRS